MYEYVVYVIDLSLFLECSLKYKKNDLTVSWKAEV